jgi:hypothetical protein
MFQLTVLRVMDRERFAAPIIVANAAHAGIVSDQLAEIGVTDATILLEPCARNTAPAIALAALAVSAPQSVGNAKRPCHRRRSCFSRGDRGTFTCSSGWLARHLWD